MTNPIDHGEVSMWLSALGLLLPQGAQAAPPAAPLTADLSVFLTSPADTAVLLEGLAALDQAARTGEADPDKVEAITTPVARAILTASGGWPTEAQLGPGGSQHLWLFVQHTHDLELMGLAVEVLPAAVARGDVEASRVALLSDRYALFTGGQQLHGSQAAPVEGVWRPIDLADPEGVDARRAAVGLGPLAEYLALLADGEPWSLEPAPLPEPIRQSVCENMGGPLCADH